MANAVILHAGKRICFISDGILSVQNLITKAEEYFKTPFYLTHNGACVDTSHPVSHYGENPVFLLVTGEKHGCDEKAENVTKRQRM